jgi:hypothetical protein
LLFHNHPYCFSFSFYFSFIFHFLARRMEIGRMERGTEERGTGKMMIMIKVFPV